MNHIGRRGAFLLFLATLDFVYAWALRLQVTPQQSHGPHLNYLLPVWVWGWIWFTTGLIVLGGAFARNDVWAFVCASLIKTAWAGLSFTLWVRGLQPNGWLSAVVWLAFAATVLLISSWPEVWNPEIIEVWEGSRDASS
jgi:hypothetical protein